MLAAIAAGCSRSPSAPSGPSGSGAPAIDGVTVSAVDGRPIGSVAIKVGTQTGVSDASGGFHIGDLTAGTLSATFAAPTLVERRTSLVAPTAEAARVSLIPAEFDLTAFDEMFRGTNGRLTRWVAAPPLVVMTTVMQYTTGARDDYVALSEQLTDEETALLIDHLTSGLALLTGDTFTAFASVSRESASAGSRVLVRRPGTIVIGRYKGVEGLLNTIGFGSWSTNAAGEVTTATMFLDRDFDRNSDMRWLLRTHELGHTLGYNHVTTRRSIMNPSIGPEPTQFDRDGSVIAFQRRPGNQSPDIDPGVQAPGGGFGVAPLPGAGVRTVICGPRP
jgi:hypothetical protein